MMDGLPDLGKVFTKDFPQAATRGAGCMKIVRFWPWKPTNYNRRKRFKEP